MASIPIDTRITEDIINYWKTGEYSQQQLANKFKVSKGYVNKICKGVEQTMTATVTAGASYKSELMRQNDRMVTALEDVTDRKAHFMSLRDRNVGKLFEAVEKKIDLIIESPASYDSIEVKNLVESNDKNCITAEIAPRHANSTNNFNVAANAGIKTDNKIVFEVIDSINKTN